MAAANQFAADPHSIADHAAPIYNALNHGISPVTQIMFDENSAGLAALAAEYHGHYHPANVEERFLVDTLVHNEWRLRRMRRVEAELWDVATKFFLAENAEATTCSSGDAFARGESTFYHLQRIVNWCERNYHRAAKELERLQSARSEAVAEPAEPLQPQQSKPSSAFLASFRQTPQTPIPGPAQPTTASATETQPPTIEGHPHLPDTA